MPKRAGNNTTLDTDKNAANQGNKGHPLNPGARGPIIPGGRGAGRDDDGVTHPPGASGGPQSMDERRSLRHSYRTLIDQVESTDSD